MSALAGIVGWGGFQPPKDFLMQMMRPLGPFGPDRQGHLALGRVHMGHLLFRTTPEELLDVQPVTHEPSRSVLVLDGRLDNREELAEALGLSKKALSSMSDSTLALACFLRWEDDAPTRLLGDFALAFWSARRQSLFLVRDPVGVRPLFWVQTPSFTAFASSPEALFCLPGVRRKLDPDALHDMLALVPPQGESTLYQDVYRVEPGWMRSFQQASMRRSQYHSFSESPEVRFSREMDYVDAFHETLDRAISCRLRSVGPLASELSSGLDSSTVTSIAARLLNDSGRSLMAFTAGLPLDFRGVARPGWHTDEVPGAQAVAAQHPNVIHEIVRSGSTSPTLGLEHTTARLGHPPLNLCNLGWQSALRSRAKKAGCRVILTGLFGNFGLSFEGHDRLSRLLATGRWWALAHEFRALRRNRPYFGYASMLGATLEPLWPSWVWRRIQGRRWGGGEPLFAYSPVRASRQTRLTVEARARAAGHDLNFQPRLNGKQARLQGIISTDAGSYNLLDDALGVQSRHPLGDQRVLSFFLGLPDVCFFAQGQVRRLFMQAMRGLLPDAVLSTETRGQQGADWYVGFLAHKDQLQEEVRRLADSGTVAGLIDLDQMLEQLESCPDDERCWADLPVLMRYRMRMLRGLSVGHFVAAHSNRNG